MTTCPAMSLGWRWFMTSSLTLPLVPMPGSRGSMQGYSRRSNEKRTKECRVSHRVECWLPNLVWGWHISVCGLGFLMLMFQVVWVASVSSIIVLHWGDWYNLILSVHSSELIIFPFSEMIHNFVMLSNVQGFFYSLVEERNLNDLCCILVIVTQDTDCVAVDKRWFLLLCNNILGWFSTCTLDCDISEWLDHSLIIIPSVLPFLLRRWCRASSFPHSLLHNIT